MAKKKSPKVKIGDRFGKLTVREQVCVPVLAKKENKDGTIEEIPSGKTKLVWECDCDCGGTIRLPEMTLLKERSTLRSCNQCKPVENPNYVPAKMTREEMRDWEELFEYVKSNIFGYGKDAKIPRYMVERLLGLLKGKFYANNKTVDEANYSYKTILNTFKYCYPEIQKALRTNRFNDEQHKFNYVYKIVESNINNVHMRMKNAEKTKERIENIDFNIINHTGAEYQRKTEEMTNELLDDLW